MKKIWSFVCVVFILIAAFFSFFDPPVKKRSIIPEHKQEQPVSPIDIYLKKRSEPVNFSDVTNTAELEQLLGNYEYDKTPQIYVRNFPNDFNEKGNIKIFIRTLLPYILRENEILKMEREIYLKISDKIMTHQKLTPKEENFFNSLVLKYEVLKPDLSGQSDLLYDKIDRISPSLAIAQALFGTIYMSKNFSSPFDIHRWNKDKQYVRVQYPNLAEAVEDYALELNRGLSYDNFHNKRSIYRGTRYELPGEVFASELSLYMIDEDEYTDTLELLFNDFDAYELDFATFKKGN